MGHYTFLFSSDFTNLAKPSNFDRKSFSRNLFSRNRSSSFGRMVGNHKNLRIPCTFGSPFFGPIFLRWPRMASQRRSWIGLVSSFPGRMDCNRTVRKTLVRKTLVRKTLAHKTLAGMGCKLVPGHISALRSTSKELFGIWSRFCSL